jgi:hypothetical protein
MMHLTTAVLWASHVRDGGRGPLWFVDALQRADGASTAIHTCCVDATCAYQIATAPN